MRRDILKTNLSGTPLCFFFLFFFSVQVGGAALFLFTSLRNETFPKRIYFSTFKGKNFLEEKLYPVRVDTIRKASKNGKSAASERYSSL